MIKELFKVLSAGLGLLGTKESRRYLDQLIGLKKDWYEEYNKTECDDARLDRIELRLRIISESFCSQVGIENTKNK